MKTNLELVRFCESKLGTPYVFGMKGEKLTRERLNELCRQYPSMFKEQYRQKAEKFIGRECTDCSGLISWFTGTVRGSAQYRETATAEKDISQLDETMIGWALWKNGHIGVYIGNGYCIEARGINYGTIKSLVTSNSWQKVLKLRDIEYVSKPIPPGGDMGDLLIRLLEWLLSLFNNNNKKK